MLLVLSGIIILTLDDCLHKQLLTVEKCYVTLVFGKYQNDTKIIELLLQNTFNPFSYSFLSAISIILS